MNHAYMPIGPVGKPTELHLAFPILTFQFTKAPQACKALTAFMLEAENFNPWIEAAQGYLSHFLNAYDANPVWTADPKRTVYRDVSKRTLTPGGLGSLGEKAAAAIADFLVVDMFANFATGREDAKGAIAVAERQAQAHLSLDRTGRRPAQTGRRRSLIRTGVERPHGRCHDHRTTMRPRQPAIGLEPAQVEPALARLLVHAAGAGDPGAVPRLSARTRRLAVVHRRQDRPRRRIHRPRELRVAAGRHDFLDLGLQHAALHDRRERHQIRRRALPRAAAQQAPAVQGDDPRRDADPVHRADGAVGDRVLVDLRHPVLDHLVVAAQAGPDLDQHRFPRRPDGTRAGR